MSSSRPAPSVFDSLIETPQERDLKELVKERDQLRLVLRRLMLNPHGCRFCDSGKSRRTPAEHDHDCVWVEASKLLDGPR